MQRLLLIGLLCVSTVSCSINNVKLLTFKSEKSLLQHDQILSIKVKNDNVLFKTKAESSYDTLNYEEVWGFSKDQDTFRLVAKSGDLKFELGNINCVSLFSRKISRYPHSIGKRYYFAVNLKMAPIQAETTNLIKYLFDNDKDTFKAFKVKYKLRGSFNSEIIEKYISVIGCPG